MSVSIVLFFKLPHEFFLCSYIVILLNQYSEKKKRNKMDLEKESLICVIKLFASFCPVNTGMRANTCNPSYSGGRGTRMQSSSPAWATYWTSDSKRYNTIQSIQYNTIQHNTTQHNTIQDLGLQLRVRALGSISIIAKEKDWIYIKKMFVKWDINSSVWIYS